MRSFPQIELGAIHYEPRVIADITKAAVEETEGVTLIPQDFSDSILEFVGIKRLSGVDVKIDNLQNAVSLDVKIRVRYGLNIPDIARQVQDIVRDRFDQLTDIDLKDVNVKVHGIERGKA